MVFVDVGGARYPRQNYSDTVTKRPWDVVSSSRSREVRDIRGSRKRDSVVSIFYNKLFSRGVSYKGNG